MKKVWHKLWFSAKDPRASTQNTNIDLPDTLVDLKRSLNKSGLCIFQAEYLFKINHNPENIEPNFKAMFPSLKPGMYSLMNVIKFLYVKMKMESFFCALRYALKFYKACYTFNHRHPWGNCHSTLVQSHSDLMENIKCQPGCLTVTKIPSQSPMVVPQLAKMNLQPLINNSRPSEATHCKEGWGK